MKFLAFTDLHGDVEILEKLKAKANNVDYVLFGGDISWFSHELEPLLVSLNKFPKPVILVHGNHESREEMHELCNKLDNLFFISSASLRFKNYIFFGYGDGGFSKKDERFAKLAKKFKKDIKKGDTVVLITHAPPYNTETDLVYEEHCGVQDIRDFLEQNKVALCITGHLHESFGNQDKINGCVIINPGPKGKIIEITK